MGNYISAGSVDEQTNTLPISTSNIVDISCIDNTSKDNISIENNNSKSAQTDELTQNNKFVQTDMDFQQVDKLMNTFDEVEYMVKELEAGDFYINETRVKYEELINKYNILNDDYYRITNYNKTLEQRINSLNSQITIMKKNVYENKSKLEAIKAENARLKFKKNYYTEQLSELKMNHERMKSRYRNTLDILNLKSVEFPPKLRKCYSSNI